MALEQQVVWAIIAFTTAVVFSGGMLYQSLLDVKRRVKIAEDKIEQTNVALILEKISGLVERLATLEHSNSERFISLTAKLDDAIKTRAAGH
jgi:hypothetical protein